MATKPRKPPATDTPAPASPWAAHLTPLSTHNVWLAGLGALASAQAEGSKAFEALVKQGMEMQNKSQALAKERMEAMASQAAAAGAASPWNRLGGIFEDRVAQALAGLGMPTAQELAALTARVDALERALGQQPPQAARPAARRAAAGDKR
ncbi:MAG: phasin family protein [Ottowia sp.]|uniref:phasin family protein n=1 Tax=Ottowia sp. TaxID=1898956 RepID=UPI0039E26C28